MTAKKAISIGKAVVNAPVVVILVGYFLIGTRFFEAMELSFWWFFPSFAIAFFMAWGYWSITAPRRLAWAYQNVTDKKELKERAIEGKLIWEDGNFFGKTMLMTKSNKAIIEEVNHEIADGKFSNEPLEKSMTLYVHKIIFWRAFAFQVGLIVFAIILIVSGLSPFNGLTFGLGLALAIFFVPTWFMKVPIMENKEGFLTIVKRYFSKEIQLKINEEGISVKSIRTGLIEWKTLHYFDIIPTTFGRVDKLLLAYSDEKDEILNVEVAFEYFSTDRVTLERLMNFHLEKERSSNS
jgi:hypothetical protein